MGASRINFRKTHLVLVVLPIAIFILSLVLGAIKGPYYLSTNLDPAYAYLLNSLNILNSYTPSHIDHPGTTLQLFGALVLYGKWFITFSFGRSGPLNNSVLSNPEGYLRAINASLVFINCLLLIWIGVRVFNACKRLLPAVTLQLTMFCFPQVLLALVNVSPEPLLIFSGLLLMLPLIPEVFGENPGVVRGDGRTGGVATGVMLGFGLATKITFFPLVGVVLLLRKAKTKLLAAVSCVIAFLFCTLPIQSQYPRLYEWFTALMTHKGYYGHGDIGFPDKATLLKNLIGLGAGEPFLFVLLILYLLVIVFLLCRSKQRSSSSRNILRLLLIGCLIMLTQLFVTAKHPAGHYLLPSMVITALVNAALVFWVQENGKKETSLISVTVAAAVLFSGLILSACGVSAWTRSVVSSQQVQKELQFELQKMQDHLIVPYYGASTLEYALAFGNDFAGRNFGKQLYVNHPSSVFYEMWGNKFYSFEGNLNMQKVLNMLKNGKIILMTGKPLKDNAPGSHAGLMMSPVFLRSSLALYRLDGFAK